MDKQTADKVTNELAALYSSIASEYDRKRQFVRAEMQVWAEELRIKNQELGIKSRVLEVGCGTGQHASLIAETGSSYTGIDISPAMIELARRQISQAEFVVGDVSHLPFTDASFNAVWAVAVLHHVPSREKREQALREMARVLQPGGRLYLFDWNLYAWRWLKRYRHFGLPFGLHPKDYDRGDVLIPWKSPAHGTLNRYYHAFTLRELERLVKNNGFRLVRQRLVSNNKTANFWSGQSIETIVEKE